MDLNNVYENVAENCSKFYPRFDVLKSCPEVSKASCFNCKNFNDHVCSLGLFDTIAQNENNIFY